MGIVVTKSGNNQLLGNLDHGGKSAGRLDHTVYLAGCGGLDKSSRQRVLCRRCMSPMTLRVFPKYAYWYKLRWDPYWRVAHISCGF